MEDEEKRYWDFVKRTKQERDELLEALEEMVREYDHNEDEETDAMVLAKAAIAHAKGGV